MHGIQKEFHFCYGHRVWSQELDGRYTERGSVKTKCRHLHGHQAIVSVTLERHELKNAMVTDFKHLGWLKDFFEDYVDHRFILDIHDPLAPALLGGDIEQISGLHGPVLNIDGRRYTQVLVETNAAGWQLEPYEEPNDLLREYYAGFLLVDFCPTSENLAEWVWKLVSQKMEPLGVIPAQVAWMETPKSSAAYIPEMYTFDPAG